MAVVQMLTFFTVAGLAAGRNFNLQNNCGYTIWVGILGNADKGTPDNGGFTLDSGERVSKVLELWVWNLVCQRVEITLRAVGQRNYHCAFQKHVIRYN
jgi:hypothetical protein